MAWVEILDNDIYYIEAGEGPPMVFLHGMSSCAEAWWQQFEHFSRRFRVIAYDSVNHGHSSNSPRDQEETDRADELEAFLRTLDIARPILAGNSMGGGTIMRWAARHPDSAAALIVSGAGVSEPGSAPRVRTINPIDDGTLFLPFGDSLTERLKQQRPRMYERYYRIRSTATRIEYLRHPRPRSSRSADETARLHETLRSVTSPMLVIVGALDRAVPNAQRLHRLVPHSRFVEVPESPHNVYYETAAQWNEAVDDFLSALRP
jgi:pimeloyl-ACP methyl ester carboxylesterase